MRSPRPWALSCVLLACNEPALDPCLSGGPVQLARGDVPRFRVEFSGGHTFVSLRGSWVNDIDHALHVGEACGADSRSIGVGLDMSPVRLHPDDPDADDPSLVCATSYDEFFRIDLDGERPPALLLPRFHCETLLATPHGPVLGERHGRGLWHVPEFPDDAGAVQIAAEVDVRTPVWLGDRVVYLAADGVRRHDLTTGVDELLVPDVADFLHTDTHLLWRARVPGDTAPMNVRDLASGTDHYVGLYHAGEDEADWDDPGPGWRFDADGAHVLHLPNTPDAPMAAFDLEGEPVPFVRHGVRLAYPAIGGVIVQHGAEVRHAVAGSATGTLLDVPAGATFDDLQVLDDRLEVRVERDLYAVPLSGAPRSFLLRRVDARRARVDDDLLLTLTDDVLTLIHQPSHDRVVLAFQVEDFVHHPGRGVYYSIIRAPMSPSNGVWLRTDASLRAAFLR